jgi:elongator complex protein 3
MSLGTTRVEFGVQLLDDSILRAVNRGHGIDAVVDATKIAKDKGLKVCYHIMPGLPGSSPEKDMESFRMMFSDERFMPDMLKIYPTLVVEGTKLFEMWQKGEYAPYTTSEAALLIADMKETVPRWARIQRIQRDIPVQLISAGVDKSDLRELACRELERTGRKCHCIRCREVGLMGIRTFSKGDVVWRDTSYRASEGEEHFISIELADRDALVGFVRLRMGDGAETANVRELKVFGQMARIGEAGTEAQHRGFGRELMAEAERMAAEKGYSSVKVTSGIGVRGYYSVMGYSRSGYHMKKDLSKPRS